MMTEKNDIGMLLITKRDGRKVPFDINKIKNAIGKAFIETGKQIDDSILNMLALQSVAGIDINHEINVESIQDAVERTLMNAHFSNEAKAYILYRKQREYARNTKLDVDKVVGDYIGDIDWRVKENSTVQFSLGGLILAEAGAVTANYWLNHYYDEEIRNAHKNCDMHIHDLSMLSGYCAGWSLKQLILEGLGGVDSKISSKPARHLHTLCNQMVNFLGIMQNEWAGAQAFSSFDTYLAPFVKIDHLEYHQVKQCIQSFVFGVNTPSRWGTQPPFTNITLDWTCPDDLKNQPAIVGGVPQDFTYGDCKEEMDIINKAFIEVMMEGDADGRGFAYPIPTYSITKDFDWSDTENNELLFGMAAKYGSPYFSNYVNSDMEPSDIRSMCCRLRLDLTELRKKNGGFFGSGESTGSVGVVTINLPKIGYEASDIDDFYRRLDKVMDIAAKSLDIKRRVITSLMEAGLYPYTKRYLGSFDNHFSTIGLVGMNECGLNAKWLHADMRDERTQKWAEEILNHMRERLVIYQQKYGALFNLESTPAESTSYRFALHDKKRYPDIKTANENGTPYYTNSTNLPVGATDDVFEALDIQDPLQILYTSGTVFHTFLGEKLPSWKSAANLIRTITNNYRLPYITLSPTYSVCKDHGYLTGEKVKCPICGQDTEVYSRITGYYRPVKNWNDGKSQEYKDRKKYLIDESKTSVCEEPIKEDIEDSNQSKMKQNEEMVSDVSITLLTKDHCPNCEVVKAYIKNSLNEETRSSIRFLNAFNDPEADELIDKYKIMSIPTMIVSDGSHTIVVHTVERIIKYLEGLK